MIKKLLISSVLFLSASSAFAQTDIQSQINALLNQVSSLQSQLAQPSTGAYTRNLTVGSRGADVTALQNFLISRGFLKIASATEYFGNLTRAALAAYQASVGISPAVGYFGPITRAKVASVGAAPAPLDQSPTGEVTPTPTPIPTPVPAPAAKPTIKTGTGTVTPNRYINFGTGSFLYAGVSPRDRRAFLYPGDPANTVAGVNPITSYSNCEDINELNYIGIKNICEFSDPAKYTFTSHDKPIRFYDRLASNTNVSGGTCYRDILLFKQGNIYGGFDPEMMDPDGTLHYRYWYDESGGTNFASLCPTSGAQAATASLLESLKSALERLKLLVK